MGYKEKIKKAPFLRRHFHYRELQERDTLHAGHIEDLKKTIKQLEDRNDEWAREVRALRHDDERFNILWPAAKEDIIAAVPGKKLPKKLKTPKDKMSIAWVVPPFNEGSGGHTTIFRAVAYFERQGHTCSIYVYDPMKTSSLEACESNRQFFPKMKAKTFYNEALHDEHDILVATSWHTAYPVYNANTQAVRFYFVQDFEPYFDPIGSYSTLAETTYKLGLYGVTFGRWLEQTLTKDFKMKCINFDLGVSGNQYSVKNTEPRNKVLFYARPVTPRRGFELGVLALELFMRKHPEFEVHFFGWDIDRYNIPFEYVNHKVLSIKELNDLYNECAAGLVLSFTNISLLPLEMYSAGCRPVVNDAPCTRMANYNEVMEFANPTPEELAEGLSRAVAKGPEVNQKKIDKLIKEYRWEVIHQKLERAVVEAANKGL